MIEYFVSCRYVKASLMSFLLVGDSKQLGPFVTILNRQG